MTKTFDFFIDRLKRAAGITTYRWRLFFRESGETVEREMAFGSPERAFYNAQDYLMSRLRNKVSDIGDIVELSIWNTRTGEEVNQVRKRLIARGDKTTVGYLVAEQLGYDM